MNRPTLFVLLGALALVSGLVTWLLVPRPARPNRPTSAVPSAASSPAPVRPSAPSAPPPAPVASSSPSLTSAADLDVAESSAALKRLRDGAEAGALRFDNPEMLAVVEELQRRETALNLRDQELRQWGERLAAEQSALQGLTQRVASMQLKLEESIRSRQEQARSGEKERWAATGRQWASLPAADVVPLAVSLPPEETLAILRAMPREAAGRVVEALGRNGGAGARQVVDMIQRLSESKPGE